MSRSGLLTYAIAMMRTPVTFPYAAHETFYSARGRACKPTGAIIGVRSASTDV